MQVCLREARILQRRSRWSDLLVEDGDKGFWPSSDGELFDSESAIVSSC